MILDCFSLEYSCLGRSLGTRLDEIRSFVIRRELGWIFGMPCAKETDFLGASSGTGAVMVGLIVVMGAGETVKVGVGLSGRSV